MRHRWGVMACGTSGERAWRSQADGKRGSWWYQGGKDEHGMFGRVDVERYWECGV